MNFVELDEIEYQKFWENHPLKTFLSAKEIGSLRKKSNWNVYFVGVKKKKEIIAAAMLLSHKRHFNCYEFYSPRGFLMDFNDEELLTYFKREISKYIKEKKGYILRIDPYIINKERDIDGNVVENGIDNTKIVKNLLSLGFKRVKEKEMEQVGWMFSLDLDGKSEEEILKEMKQNTRNIIRKTEKDGITIKELSYEELDRFHKILVETGKRKEFSVRDISYYQEMYKLFHDKGEVKYYITELDLNNHINLLETEKNTKIEKLTDTKISEARKKTIEEEIAFIDKRINDAKEIKEKTNQDVITLSGSMFILIKPEIVYLSSGNYEEYLHFNSQYLIQWIMIKYGIDHGFKKHNFYGIPANIADHPKDYGIYKFKRGFNGYVEELIGEYELKISNHYYLFKLIHKLKGGRK